MRAFIRSVVLFAALMFCVRGSMAQESVYSVKVTTIDGESVELSRYQGKALLIVNVASQCGYTSQYAGLQKLYTDYADKGLVVLGFPSNDFGGQEPGSEAEIKHFCSSKFGVTFPMFAKVKVVGQEKHPLYQLLSKSTGGEDVGWNFEKFLVDRNGLVVARFKSGVKPSDAILISAIDEALKVSATGVK
jgi:glutathione peroxidase